MGLKHCCNRRNELEELLNSHVNNLRLFKMDFEKIDENLRVKMTGNLDSSLMRKHSQTLINALNNISKENFMKIANENFIGIKDCTEFIQTQLSIMNYIYEDSNRDLINIKFNLLPYLSPTKNKLNLFINLLTLHTGSVIIYPIFKRNLHKFIENSLLFPVMALNDSLNSFKSDLAEEFKYHLDVIYNKDNIKLFVEKILYDFEKTHFINCNEYMYKYEMNFLDYNKIFDKYSTPINSFFDLMYLRGLYLSYYL